MCWKIIFKEVLISVKRPETHLNPNQQGNNTKKSQYECDWSKRQLFLSQVMPWAFIWDSGLLGIRDGWVMRILFTTREVSPYRMTMASLWARWAYQAVRTDDLSCLRMATLPGSDSILTEPPSADNYLSVQTFLQGEECAKRLAAKNIFVYRTILLFILNAWLSVLVYSSAPYEFG